MKSSLFLIFSFLVLFSLGTAAMVGLQPEFKTQLSESYHSLIESAFTNEMPDISDALIVPEEIFVVPKLEPFRGRLKKDAYDLHLAAAESSEVGLIQNEEILSDYLANESLVEASSGNGYRVEKLSHSHPFLTPKAKEVLEQLGKTFESQVGEGEFFTVTSGTRTMDQQKKLKRRNRNATSGNSSHSYGVSFDISYIRFNGVKAFDYERQKQLEAVLNYFQETEKIYVIKERKQSCYHVTVR
ncbi:DUF5715 family protein [Algoriphagus namhaensis]